MLPARYSAGPPNKAMAAGNSRCPPGCAMVISSATAHTTMPATMGMWKYVYTARAIRPGSAEPRDLAAAALGTDVEVDPPHGDAAEECHQERADRRRRSPAAPRPSRPVTRMDSPSAIMTNSAQRSAMCAPSTFQSAVLRAPEPRHEVAHERPADFERERHHPQPPRARTLPRCRPRSRTRPTPRARW